MFTIALVVLIVFAVIGASELMRAGPLAAVSILPTWSAAFAAEQMAPSDIKATFFNGQSFTASTPGGTKFTMTFTPDGKMTRELAAKREVMEETGYDVSVHQFPGTMSYSEAAGRIKVVQF